MAPSKTIRGFDNSRWVDLQATPAIEPWQALPDHVYRTSAGRPWRGLAVWHQVGPLGDLYVPPTSRHSILLRCGTSNDLLQRHGDITRLTRLVPGHTIILPAHTPSFWRSTSPRNNVHLDIEPAWLERAGGSDVELRSCFGSHDPVLASLAQALLASLDNNVSLSAAFGDNLALSIALHLLENYSKPTLRRRDQPTLSRRQMTLLLETLRDSLHERWQVVDMASLVDLSPFHFSRAFKTAFGVPPHAYLTQLRMEAAARLLRRTHRTVADIAQATGHPSPAHFAQRFRQHWGVSPSIYRRAG